MDAKRREEIINIIIEGMPHNNSAWGRNRKSNIRWLNEAIDLTEKAVAEEIFKLWMMNFVSANLCPICASPIIDTVFDSLACKAIWDEFKKKFGICSEKDGRRRECRGVDNRLSEVYEETTQASPPSEKQVTKKGCEEGPKPLSEKVI
jgi:hypothetical protein